MYNKYVTKNVLREKIKLIGNVSQKRKHKLKETGIYFRLIVD
jgi:hypothetical protein